MKKLAIPFVLLCLLINNSCSELISSNDIAPEQILRYYHAYHSHGDTYITAEFFAEGGLTIPPFQEPYGKNITLDSPCKVYFNGQEMEYKKDVFKTVTYKIALKEWPKRFRWDWIDKNGKKYSDSASMDMISLDDNCLVSDGNGYSITWIGSPIKKGEEITVRLEDGEDTYQEISSETGDRKIKINKTGFGMNPSYSSLEISRSILIRNVEKYSQENYAGCCIELTYNYKQYSKLF